jgi:hypothetical protein
MRGTRQVAGALVAVALGLLGCTGSETSEEPAASTPNAAATTEPAPLSVNVGVVLPPRVGLGAAATERLESDLARLADRFGPDLRSVRVVTPPAAELAPDLAAVLTDRGTQLVCVLGPGALETVLAEVALHPELRYCAAPVTEDTDLPSQVVGRDVRAEELGRVVGTVAATVGRGPVGFVGGSDELAAAAFRTGLLAGLGDRELVDGEGPAEDAVEQVLAAGAGVVVLDPGADGARTPWRSRRRRRRCWSPRVRWGPRPTRRPSPCPGGSAGTGSSPPPSRPTSASTRRRRRASGWRRACSRSRSVRRRRPAADAALESVLTELTAASTTGEPDAAGDRTP